MVENQCESVDADLSDDENSHEDYSRVGSRINEEHSEYDEK
jgi:hypothetical protein